MLLRIYDVTLTVSDLTRAIDFYQNTLGLRKQYATDTYAGFDGGGVQLGLRQGVPPSDPTGTPLIDFQVADIETVYATLKERGVHFSQEPHTAPWGGHIAFFEDPDGNQLELIQVD